MQYLVQLSLLQMEMSFALHHYLPAEVSLKVFQWHGTVRGLEPFALAELLALMSLVFEMIFLFILTIISINNVRIED